MSYTKIVDYAAKDALSTGNAAKLIKGAEIGAEFDAVAVADALNIKTTGNQSMAGIKTFSDTTDATSSTAAGVIMSCGLAVAKKIKAGTDVSAATFNGNTFTTGTGVLTIAAAKTLTASNTLTLAGTDSTTMTFPSTSATIARTDAANTFTGVQTMTSPVLVTPALGTPASGDLRNCSLAVPPAIGGTTPAAGAFTTVSATSSIGYTTGAGGTVTQATSKSTSVTLNKLCGLITMYNTVPEAIAADAFATFTLNNSFIDADDVVLLSTEGGASSTSNYHYGHACGSGFAAINVRNITTGSLSEAVVIKFMVIKGVTA